MPPIRLKYRVASRCTLDNLVLDEGADWVLDPTNVGISKLVDKGSLIVVSVADAGAPSGLAGPVPEPAVK